jgi:hypothetical protein
LHAKLTTLVCKKKIVANSNEVKTGPNVAEPSKNGCFANDDDYDDDDILICTFLDNKREIFIITRWVELVGVYLRITFKEE